MSTSKRILSSFLLPTGLNRPRDLDAMPDSIQPAEGALPAEQDCSTNLSGQLNEGSSGRLQANSMAREYWDEISSLEVQLSAMCESKCPRGEYEGRQ
jgi:hypothetical protein